MKSLGMIALSLIALVIPSVGWAQTTDQTESLRFDDPKPKVYQVEARASELDPRAREYPEIGFVFTDAKGKPADVQHASVDTRVKPRGKMVIWLMPHNQALFERLNSYGLHAIQPHYANKWFSKCCQEDPIGEHCRGNLRLEAATGEDFSDQVAIAKPDGMVERVRQMVMRLAKDNPQGKWDYFLGDRQSLRWDDIIVAGSSHGSSTAARFSKHQKVSRVVTLCGPRDKLQSWQSLPSATPGNRIFGFTHTLDEGWVHDHYCRSWELMGLNQYGPIVDVDSAEPPFGNSRRLTTSFDVGGNAGRAHGSVQPGTRAKKNADGSLAHEAVWKYLFTHPVIAVGDPVARDVGCDKDQRE